MAACLVCGELACPGPWIDGGACSDHRTVDRQTHRGAVLSARSGGPHGGAPAYPPVGLRRLRAERIDDGDPQRPSALLAAGPGAGALPIGADPRGLVLCAERRGPRPGT